MQHPKKLLISLSIQTICLLRFYLLCISQYFQRSKISRITPVSTVYGQCAPYMTKRLKVLTLPRTPSIPQLCVKDNSKKEVFQPHLPVRLPCYDLAPITCFALGRSSRSRTSGAPDFHGLTGGVYKARERIHRAMADARLLANPASRSRVADSDPN